MNQQQILDLYQWAPGICFRHPSKREVPTTHVETIRPAAGGIQDVRACKDCVVAMEEQRQEAAQRHGEPYSPGHLGSAEGGDTRR
ncbi:MULTISPECIES: hypothetical protein [Streptomyces]|uniref:Uncharacterized protein n=1 Tax=Streptomyces dengpaensis TaxID=2049881 RepID=A0ABN5IAK7_9ACTN|nr:MULTISPECIES: hypothetical protein [Streptomyces]AVH60039.1 hypothetical protein C4B68_34380 [Streptomyces dengpaensis]PIB09679.1 hypothetical protein B1C81_11060 [Streptomyces sp. HG99]